MPQKQMLADVNGKSLTTAINRDIIDNNYGAGINPTDVTLPLGSGSARSAGSSPVRRTIYM